MRNVMMHVNYLPAEHEFVPARQQSFELSLCDCPQAWEARIV